jgi:hypothetical protein
MDFASKPGPPAGQVAVLLGALRNGRAVSCIIELVLALIP